MATHPRTLSLVEVQRRNAGRNPTAETLAASKPRRVGQGFQRGYEMPLGRWGAGESEVSPRVMKRRYVLLVQEGSSLDAPQAGGMQRGRAAGPLAKIVLYYNTHLAVVLKCFDSHFYFDRLLITLCLHLLDPFVTISSIMGCAVSI